MPLYHKSDSPKTPSYVRRHLIRTTIVTADSEWYCHTCSINSNTGFSDHALADETARSYTHTHTRVTDTDYEGLGARWVCECLCSISSIITSISSSSAVHNTSSCSMFCKNTEGSSHPPPPPPRDKTQNTKKSKQANKQASTQRKTRESGCLPTFQPFPQRERNSHEKKKQAVSNDKTRFSHLHTAGKTDKTTRQKARLTSPT